MSENPNTHDLTTVAGIEAYIGGTPFASHTITVLSDGGANYAYRIHLNTPFEGQETLVLKVAAPYVKSMTSVPFALYRQRFEYEAMTRIKAWLPPDSPVTVPTVYKLDSERGVLVMEDCGAGVLTLKEFLRQGRASPGLAETIGASLGHFIGAMHSWSRADPGGILGVFRENEQGFRLSAWVTYGQVVQTLKPGDGDRVLPALVDPPLEVPEKDLEMVRRVAKEMQEAMMSARDVFVQGDFWPGNIMVTLDDKQQLRRLYILDWELAKPGLPGVELGQFCAEIHTLRRCVPAAASSATTLLETFLQAYALEYKPDAQLARHALVHCGAHLVIWTPRNAWADKETTRKVVEEGMQIIVAASDATEEGLSKSLVGPLLL